MTGPTKDEDMNRQDSGQDDRDGETAGQRVSLRCPRCDHIVVSAPAGHRFRQRAMICPGCGAEIEPPEVWEKSTGGLMDRLQQFLRRLTS